jgi:nicotinate-nucleotide pyrophosphorylase (carboxylating)
MNDTDQLIDQALEEDLGSEGDVTSIAIFGKEKSSLRLISKDTGILAGTDIFRKVFQRVDPDTRVNFIHNDGQPLKPGDIVAEISGRTGALLSAERTALNFISFLSGIATGTKRLVDAARRHGKAQILDTRKTLPGYRALSKHAVKMGGGENHRMGLYDMVIIKDNHIDLAGSLTGAVDKVREKWKDRFRIEVECRTMEDVKAALEAGADSIMLDNMAEDKVRKAVRMLRSRPGKSIKIEASGNMDMEKVKTMSAAGVDFISVGKITHSVRGFDFSLKAGS